MWCFWHAITAGLLDTDGKWTGKITQNLLWMLFHMIFISVSKFIFCLSTYQQIYRQSSFKITPIKTSVKHKFPTAKWVTIVEQKFFFVSFFFFSWFLNKKMENILKCQKRIFWPANGMHSNVCWSKYTADVIINWT